MEGQLSDGSLYRFERGYQSLIKEITFRETLFRIEKRKKANTDHIFTTNAKIYEVYYTVHLNGMLEIVQQGAEKVSVETDSSEEHSFDVDPNLFVEAAKFANLPDFAHPEIIKALSGMNPEAVDSLATGVVASMFEMQGTE